MIAPLLLGVALGASPAAPPVRIVGFQDQPGDCPPLEARRGACVERVDLLDPASIFGADGLPRAAWEALGRLHFGLWEDLAHQGFGEDSPLTLTLGAAGYTALPEARALWTDVQAGPHHSAPDPARWMPASTWGLGEGPGLWRAVRVHQPAGLPTPGQTVLMKGRFALRLGYDGRPHDFDLMDADPGSSGPFFEQLYPFRRGAATGSGPLKDYDLPEALSSLVEDPSAAARLRQALSPTLLPTTDYAGLTSVADEQFRAFARLLGVVIAQYALQDYTVNQMRVLGALTLLRGAPGGPEATAGRSRDLVAASLGQTDDRSEQGQKLDSSVYALQGGFQLRYDQLPDRVVERWLGALGPPEDLSALNAAARALLGDLLRPGAAPLRGADPDAVRAWAAEALRPGTDADRLASGVLALALSDRVAALPATERDAVETWILLDHVQSAVSSALDPSGQSRLSPAAFAASTTSQWASVLGRHGHRTRAMGQGLGAVDPTSICTTGDGPAALDEETIGAVNLDLLLAAPAGLTDATEVLWAARDQTPVLAIDDPATTRPSLSRIVDLPDGQTLYRVRWTLWSGWHLWWTAQELGGLTRAALRTGAVCEDMVLAPAALAPTVARAALLDGELRPTSSARRADVRAERRAPPKLPSEPISADDAISGAAAAGSAGVAGVKSAQSTASELQRTGDPSALAGAATGLLSARSADLPDEGEVSERVAWLRELVGPGLSAEEAAGALVEVLELDAWGRRPRDARPRTPYLRVKRRADHQAVAGAGWVLYVAPSQAPLRLAPATRPRDSVASDAPMPRWRRLPTQDWALSGSVAAFPWRQSEATCSSTASDLDVVGACDGGSYTFVSQGLSADLVALGTRWISGQPRWALEAGLAAHLDVVLPGEALLDESGTDYDWALRPQGGLILGARMAPRPADLVTGLLPGPWGADGPDGFSPVHRSELGLRVGFLSGPGYNGLEATALGELWWASALRRDRAPQASLTPYHPAALLGPFVRYQYGFTLLDDGETQLLELSGSHTVFVGVRGQVRLAAQASAPSVSR